MEVWKTYPGYGHQFSNRGRVISPNGNIISGYPNQKGYMIVDMGRRRENRKCVTIHTAVAKLFIGERPSPDHQINHKDGIKRNNYVENLEYVTASENVIHSILNGLSTRKLSPEDIMKIVLLRDEGRTHKEISIRMGISKLYVGTILTGKAWQYLTGIERLDYPKRGEGSPGAKLKEKSVLEIRKLIGTGITNTEIARKFGVSVPTITDIKNRKSWKHLEATSVI